MGQIPPMSLTNYNRFFLNSSLVLVVVQWVVLVLFYDQLPEYIMGLEKESLSQSAYFDKDQVWIPPIICTLLFAGLLWLSYRPWLFYFPFASIQVNMHDKKEVIGTLIRGILFLLTVIFQIWTLQQIVIAFGYDEGVLVPFWILLLVLLIGMMIFFYRKFTQLIYSK